MSGARGGGRRPPSPRAMRWGGSVAGACSSSSGGWPTAHAGVEGWACSTAPTAFSFFGIPDIDDIGIDIFGSAGRIE